jgi:hypothetical protein
MCNRVKEIRVNVDIIPLTGSLNGNYVDDENFKESFQNWLNDLWVAKDRRIEEMLEAF